MGPSTSKEARSKFSETGATEVAETPELYLEFTTKCMERVHEMLSLRTSSGPKFNQKQCTYLANKLDMAVQSAHSIVEQINSWYLSSGSFEDTSGCLENFKVLFAMGLESEGIIQSCYLDAPTDAPYDTWIQSAIMLTNVSERVASIGFNLELCIIVFSERNLERLKSFTLAEIASMRQAEAEIVKERANLDETKLCVDLRNVTQLSMSSRSEWQLATFLLGRLESATRGLPTSYECSHSKINMRYLEQMESLGKGASGIVHRSIWLGAEVAKKTFHGPSNPDFLREVSILAGLSHPNIVSLLWYTTDQRKSHLIMELMDGDLYTLMQARIEEHGNHGSPFNISEALDLMLQIAEGVLFLHEKKIVHRDLKSHNILVRCGKAPEGAPEVVDFKYVQAKVADFGLSRTKEASMTYSQQTQNMGTTRWMAPEMIKFENDDGTQAREVGLKYPFKSDVYSFAMVCFEILTGDVPFSALNLREVKSVVLGGGRPELPDECPHRLRTLIEACWSSEATTRPRFDDICSELRHLKYERLMFAAWVKVSRSFSLDEIRRMTNEFSEGNRFGVDNVYKGVMVDTGELVAVERAQHNSDLLSPDIWLKVELHHENLVGYVGYCYENGERIHVFEFMPNYTLAGWLMDEYGDKCMYRDWRIRRNICFGVTNGIHCLHTEALAKSIHRPINLRTIFLDANLKPKIGRFLRSSTVPEYGSEKVDVYNYGVVLLEIVSRRIVRGWNQPQEWAQESYSSGYLEMFIDPDLYLSPGEMTEAIRIIRIALLCIYHVAEKRPDMTLVVAMFQGNLDAEIFSLCLEHEREISELEWVVALQAADHVPPPPPSVPSQEPVLAKKKSARSWGSSWLSRFKKNS